MTTATQLEFDLGIIEAMCPRCGHRAPMRAFLRRSDVLADPRVDTLSKGTREFIRVAPESWLRGMPMGVSRIAKWSGYSPPGAYKHLLLLTEVGLVQRQPKRIGGAYSIYRFSLS